MHKVASTKRGVSTADRKPKKICMFCVYRIAKGRVFNLAESPRGACVRNNALPRELNVLVEWHGAREGEQERNKNSAAACTCPAQTPSFCFHTGWLVACCVSFSPRVGQKETRKQETKKPVKNILPLLHIRYTNFVIGRCGYCNKRVLSL